ncbi:hypothetical protein [Asticcacaulis sp. AC402]|uniref:hypothetical protein n=1 Tax=Asticcacaulis sp. AC402 TaxID=1282361 RepID=UPI0003C3BEAF|nr:hypothetical protein [Asticcacaulis sp. AC402]ESQ74891.1 hypothetical protein ABAC402_12110 [Asticcacaulis sp. AC402]
MYKLGRQENDEWLEHVHLNTYEIQDGRLVAGVPFGDPKVFEHLLLTLRPPYGLLYLLHTPAGKANSRVALKTSVSMISSPR